MLAAEAACSSLYSFTLSCVLSANRPAGIPGQPRLCPRERCGQNAHPRQLENRHGIWPKTFTSAEWTKSSMRKYFDISIVVFTICFPQDQLNRNKVPEWQRIAGKAAKEVEKFAKEKADIVLMHWRDKMGIAQKEVRISLPLQKGFTSYVSYKLLRLLTVCSGVFSMRCSSSCWCRTVPQNPEANSITYFAAAASVILHEEQRRLYCRPTSGGNPTCQDVHLISLCLAYLLLKLLFFPFFAVLHSSSVCSLRWLRVTIARSCFKANLCATHYYLKCVCVCGLRSVCVQPWATAACSLMFLQTFSHICFRVKLQPQNWLHLNVTGLFPLLLLFTFILNDDDLKWLIDYVFWLACFHWIFL